ncbi:MULTISPECIES: hypothetical protein [Psychrobacter]|nr:MULTISPECIES: hypothetical protein [Psychrobacter]
MSCLRPISAHEDRAFMSMTVVADTQKIAAGILRKNSEASSKGAGGV